MSAYQDVVLLVMPAVLLPTIFQFRNCSLLIRSFFTCVFITALVFGILFAHASPLVKWIAQASSFIWMMTCIDLLILRTAEDRKRLTPLTYTLDMCGYQHGSWLIEAKNRILWVLAKVPISYFLMQIMHNTGVPEPSSTTYYIYVMGQVLTLFLVLSAVSDTGSAIFNLVFACSIGDNWQYPLLTTSPRDFWSKRWNRLCRKYFHVIIFKPIVNHTHSPTLAGIVIFLISGLMHDYLNYVSMGDISFDSTIYFLIHGTACSIQVYLQRRYAIFNTVPAFIAWTLNSIFFVATAPIFFAPYIRTHFWTHVFAAFKIR